MNITLIPLVLRFKLWRKIRNRSWDHALTVGGISHNVVTVGGISHNVVSAKQNDAIFMVAGLVVGSRVERAVARWRQPPPTSR